jgi:hypothetical protein
VTDPLPPFRWPEACTGDEHDLLGEIFCVSFARAFAPAAEITGVALTLTAANRLHFVGAARKHERSTKRGRDGQRAMSREKSAEIRQWAKVHGLPLSERGRIASTVVEKTEDPRDTP